MKNKECVVPSWDGSHVHIREIVRADIMYVAGYYGVDVKRRWSNALDHQITPVVELVLALKEEDEKDDVA